MTRLGCCGFPRGRKTYFRTFETVEVQATFYKPPRLETLKKWRQEAPAHFEFTLKAWQLITHPPESPTYRRAGLQVSEADRPRLGLFQPTPEVFEAWERTREMARVLGARLVLFQTPPRFGPEGEHLQNLRAFFGRIARGPLLLAWEPRGKWESRLVKELCRELDLIHCVDPGKERPTWGTPRYFRLHGGAGYRHRYTTEELRGFLGALGTDQETYWMFNNIWMFEDAQKFADLFKMQSA